MSNVTFKNLMSVPEAAGEIGISEVLVLRYINQGRLRAQKLAGRWMIDADSVSKFREKPRRAGNPNFCRKTS